MKIDKVAIKSAIIHAEAEIDPIQIVSKISQVRVEKDNIVADVTLYDGENKQTYHNCKYPLSILNKK